LIGSLPRERLEWLQERSVAFPWERLTLAQYYYAHSDTEIVGVIICVADATGETYYHRFWPRNNCGWVRLTAWEDYFIDHFHCRARWQIRSDPCSLLN
jgi:hypothetical protein